MDCSNLLIFLFILPIAISEDFQQTALDLEYINSDSPIVLPCQVNREVRTCGWMKNGCPLIMEHGKYEMHGDQGVGTCSLHIYQPKIGEDTTFYNCNPVVEITESLISLPYRILARNGESQINRPPYSLSFKISKDGTPINRKISLTGEVGSTTRVRWFIDGDLQTANVKFTKKSEMLSHMKSSVQVTSKVEAVLVNYCVEIKTNNIYKQVFIGVAYVIGDTYQISEFPSEPLIRTLPFKIIPPKLRMFWYYNGKETIVNDNRIILKVNNIKNTEITVKCVDIAATPSIYLNWGLIDPNGNADVIDQGSEFKSNESKGEMISVKIKFIHPSQHISLQCQAKNVLHSGIERDISVVITFREIDPCFVAHGNSAALKIQSSFLLLPIAFILYNFFVLYIKV